MKFAHIRVSEYFTFAEQIFHSEAISLARRANFIEKSTCHGKYFFQSRSAFDSLLCLKYKERPTSVLCILAPATGIGLACGLGHSAALTAI